MKWVIKETKKVGDKDLGDWWLQEYLDMRPLGYAPVLTHKREDAMVFSSKRDALHTRAMTGRKTMTVEKL